MAIENLKVKHSFYLEVCNMLYQPLGLLTDGTRYSAYDIEISRVDNDADKLSFSISEKSPKFKYLVNENMVLMDGEYYLIKKISLEDSESYNYRFECEHEICAYKEKLNGKIELIGESPQVLITEVCTNTTSPLPIKFGGTDIVGKYRRLISDEQSVFANLVSIAEVFNARLVFKKIMGVINVWLLANPKDKGRFVEKKKDLNSVNLEYDSSEMYTRLHYFGASDNDTGNEITMHDVNPTGKSYIEDFSYYLNQGYSLEDIKASPNCIREMTIRNQDLTTPQQVYDMAVQEMENICKPKFTASIDIIDLQQVEGYILEPIEIGDLIRVYDYTKGDTVLHLEATVVGITKRSENPIDISVTLSNVIEINSALKDLVNSSQTIDKVTNGGNTIQGVFVQVGKNNLVVEVSEQNKKITNNSTEIKNNSARIDINSREISSKVSEDVYTEGINGVNRRLSTAEQKITPDAISNTVNENLNNGKSIKGMATELTKDYFRVKNTNNSARVDMENGNITTRDVTGNLSTELNGKKLRLYNWKKANQYAGAFGSLATEATNRYGVGIYGAYNSNYVVIGIEKSDNETIESFIELDNSTKEVTTWKPINTNGHNIKCARINQHDTQYGISINSLTIKGNALNGEWRDGGTGWLRLNLNSSNLVAVGAGNGQGSSYGTMRAATFQTMNSLEISTQNSRIASHSAQSVHETISDIGHGKIGDDGECIIFFDNDFLDFADTNASYFITYETVGRDSANVKTYEKNNKYFVVGGEVGQEFSYKIECKKIGSNSNRYFRDIAQDHTITNGGLDNVQSLKDESVEKEARTGVLKYIETLVGVKNIEQIEQLKELKESNPAMRMASELTEIKKMEEFENEQL